MQKMISNIVFTKNRPLQLHAYLESLYRYFPLQIIRTYIIYKEELFGEQYDALFQRFSDCIVIREKDFHNDFLKLLDRINTKLILFGVDDVVYFDSVDFEVIDEAFNKFPNDVFGFSLRFSEQNIKDSNDPIRQDIIAGQIVYRMSWTQGQTPTTRYPFELCATIYLTALVKKIIGRVMNNNPLVRKLFSPGSLLIKAFGKTKSPRSVLKSFGYFFNPNTLESWSCRWCQNHSAELPNYLYFQKLCASAIQVNMVNISARKKFNSSDEYTVETLAEKYKQGYRLDIDFVSQNKPSRTHLSAASFRLTRNRYSTI